MITRFGNVMAYPRAVKDNEDIEGQITYTATPGSAPQYAPPSKGDELASLRAEVHHLRQILYHRATHSEERNFVRWKQHMSNISTSAIANSVNNLSQYGLAQHKPVKMSPQFIFRLIYTITERIVGAREVRWEDKPSGLSKLKWLWRNNLLFMLPFAINAFEALVEEMMKADAAGTAAILNKLDKQLSKAQKRKP